MRLFDAMAALAAQTTFAPFTVAAVAGSHAVNVVCAWAAGWEAS